MHDAPTRDSLIALLDSLNIQSRLLEERICKGEDSEALWQECQRVTKEFDDALDQLRALPSGEIGAVV